MGLAAWLMSGFSVTVVDLLFVSLLVVRRYWQSVDLGGLNMWSVQSHFLPTLNQALAHKDRKITRKTSAFLDCFT